MMKTTDSALMSATGSESPRHKRRLRNYLLDGSLQLRYTGFIIVVAVLLTGILGYQVYSAVREQSEIIVTSGIPDPDIANELRTQFRASDSLVLWWIVGFGAVLVVSIAGAGIWITHKVAGPLYNMSRVCGLVRGNKLSPALRQLRKGDELQDFYSSFREMHEALRSRTSADIGTLTAAISALTAIEDRSPAAQEALEALERLRQEKEDSLSQG